MRSWNRRLRWSLGAIDMLVLLIERFRNGDAGPVYERVRAEGRGLPDGLRYVDSWVTRDLTCCYQVMEVTEPHALETWMEAWSDLVDFEVVPVISSTEAAERA